MIKHLKTVVICCVFFFNQCNAPLNVKTTSSQLQMQLKHLSCGVSVQMQNITVSHNTPSQIKVIFTQKLQVLPYEYRKITAKATITPWGIIACSDS